MYVHCSVSFHGLSVWQASSKKRKLATGKAGTGKGKQKAYERISIPLPDLPNDEDAENVSDEDVQFFTENLATGGFLGTLDHNAIARQVD
jgi:nucleolar complex protein 3